MDDVATRVINSALTMYDIMERRVTIVESINKQRQPFPDMDVIYFVSPCIDSVRAIIADFPSGKKGKYGNVHIIFTNPMSNDVFAALQSCPVLVSKLKSLKEIYLEFIVAESSVYHLDLPQSLCKLYGEVSDSNHPSLLAAKLTSLCITLNEFPYIRYQNSSPYCREAARVLNENLTKYKRSNSTFVPFGEERTDRERGQMLILDRTFDPLTPLMHDYSYLSMISDYLPFQDGVVTYDSQDGKGPKVSKQSMLNESDDFWVDNRHLHVARVIENNKKITSDFFQNNATAKMQMNQKSSASAGDPSIADLAAVVKEFPEYKQVTQKMAQHSSILNQCMDPFTKQRIIDVSAVEQIISTGVDDNDTEVKGRALVEKVSEILRDPNISKDIKVRLLAVFYVGVRGASNDDKRALIQAAKLTGSEQQILINFERLLRDASMRGDAPSVSKGIFGIFKKTAKAATGGSSSDDYQDSRHVCTLKVLLDQLMANELPLEKFPTMGAQVPSSSSAASAAKSVRKFNANSRWGKKDSHQFTGGRFLLFIAGGVCNTELKVAHDSMLQQGREIVIGGSQIITAASYINDVSNLNASGSAAGARTGSL